MALQDIVTVNISLQTSGVSRAGFGVPIFIGSHRWFTERVRSYPDVTAAAVDLPSGSDELIAVTAAFAQDIPPSIVKVGRRDVDLLTYTPDAVTAVGQVFEITVVGTDSVAIAASFTTTTGSETATDVVTALTAALSGIVGVTVGGTSTLTLAEATPGTPFAVTKITKLTQAATVTETAEAVIAAIEIIDNDFFFVASNDHTQVFILAMAAAIEARTKIYFVSVQEADAITALQVPPAAGDTLGKLEESNFFRTSGWFHHTADTAFPEMAFIAIAAPSDPGAKIWANNRIAAVAASQDPATNIPLTFTQTDNLNNRNANWIGTVGGIDITRIGKVSADEFIDIIRNRDFLEARITEGLQNKQINSPVIPFTDPGINEIRSVVTSVLDRSVSTQTVPNILQDKDPYTTNFPRAADVSFADKQARTLNASFTAFLAGAIQITVIQGTLTFDASA
jgi:hypothetical protein